MTWLYAVNTIDLIFRDDKKIYISCVFQKILFKMVLYHHSFTMSAQVNDKLCIQDFKVDPYIHQRGINENNKHYFLITC